MSGPAQVAETPIENRRQLVEYLAAGSKPKTAWRIGTEHEKFAFRTDDLRPLPYDDGTPPTIKNREAASLVVLGNFTLLESASFTNSSSTNASALGESTTLRRIASRRSINSRAWRAARAALQVTPSRK